MSRVRQFTIVFHNVKDDCKPQVTSYFSTLGYEKFVSALEPYPQSDGYHIHVFVKFKNPRRFTPFLEEMKRLAKQIVADKPTDCETDWGRVQLDRMYGTFEQATAYLQGATKDKPLDPEVELKDKKKEAAMEKYLQAVQEYHKVYYYFQAGKYLSVGEWIQMCQDKGIPLDPLYQKLSDIVNSDPF